MTTEFKPLVGAATTPGAGGPTFRCDETNRPAGEPSLEAMTKKAIQLLENRKGFFLQVEGASTTAPSAPPSPTSGRTRTPWW